MPVRWLPIIFVCALFSIFLKGCHTAGLTVKRLYLNRNSLASTFVKSPDPRQINPLKGEKLVISWSLPKKSRLDQIKLMLTVMYRDASQATFVYPIHFRRGMACYALLGQDYIEKGGLLTYKAEMINEKGDVVEKWEQMLWFDQITIEEIDILE